MGYVEEHLTPGEKVEFRTHIHWAVYVPMAGPLLLGIVLVSSGSVEPRNDSTMGFGFAFLFVAAVMWVKAYIRRKTCEVAITSRRVLIKEGLLGRHSVELLLSAVEGIRVNQSLMGRLLGYGSIVVSGRGGTPELFADIAQAMEFRNQVQVHATATGAAGPASVVPSGGGPFCSKCGGPNAAGARFCSRCGEALPG